MQASNNVTSLINSMQSELDEILTNDVHIDETIDNELIPTGIDYLDLLLGGGFAMGSLTLLAGDPGTFKSTLAGNMCSALRRKYPESLVLYLDSENAMSPQRLKMLGLEGVKPRSNLTVEKVFSTIQALMMFKDDKKIKDLPTIIVWDSIANTPTEAELVSKSVNETIGLKARILSNRLPVIINKIKEYNIALVFINQYRDRIQMGMFQTANDLRHMAHDKTMPGGNSPKFNASQFLQLKVSRVFDYTNSPYGFRATMIKVKTIKNKFFPDGYEVELVVDPTNGFHNLFTNLEMLKTNKKIVTGAWSYLKDYKEKKFQGIKNLLPTYNEHEEFRKHFDRNVKETINELQHKMQNFQVIEGESEENAEQSNINSEIQQDFQEPVINNIITEQN